MMEYWALKDLKLANSRTRFATEVCAGKNRSAVYICMMLLQVLEADLNLLVVQRGNLLTFYAVLPLVLRVSL